MGFGEIRQAIYYSRRTEQYLLLLLLASKCNTNKAMVLQCTNGGWTLETGLC